MFKGEGLYFFYQIIFLSGNFNFTLHSEGELLFYFIVFFKDYNI